MKKSKFIGIGLLALSISACKDGNQPKYPTYNADSLAAANYYIREGENVNYYAGDYNYPIWIYHDFYYSPHFGYVARPGVVYHTTVRTPGSRSVVTRSTSTVRSTTSRSSFQSSSAGRSFSVSRGSVSRGGFGSSGHMSASS